MRFFKEKSSTNLHWPKFVYFLLSLIFILSSCNENQDSGSPLRSSLQDSIATKNEIQNTDLLQLYFQNPLDFYLFKSKEKNMLNCGNNSPSLIKPDTIGLNYNYCLFNVIAGKSKIKTFKDDERVLTFHTWKKSLEGKEGYYSAKNEILLGIQCCIQDERLAQSDWVKKDSAFVVSQLGQPQTKTNNQFYYYQKNTILILNFVQDRVSWYKYFVLDKSIQKEDLLNKELINWISIIAKN